MNKETNALYQRANELKNLNKNAEAAETFLEILKAEPANMQLAEEAARLYEKLGKAAEAQKYFELCLKNNHNTDEMAFKLAQFAFNRADYGKTFEYFMLIADKQNYVSPQIIKTLEHFTTRGEREALELIKTIYKHGATVSAANTILNCAEIMLGKTELLSSPKILVIEPTGKCNFNCIMCGKTADTSHELTARQKDEIKEMLKSAESCAWAGGEPFMYPYMAELLEAAHLAGAEQALTTNASLLTEEIIEKLARWNVKVIISIDGSNKEIYESIRRGASFETLIKKLDLIKKYKAQFPHFNTEICFVVMEENYKCMGQMLDLAKEYKFNAVIFNPRDFKPENFSNEMLDHLNKNKTALQEKAQKYGIALNYWLADTAQPSAHNFEKKQNLPKATDAQMQIVKAEVEKLLSAKQTPKQVACTLPWTSFFLHAQTGAGPNCYCPHLERDWKKYSTVKRMWNSQKFSAYRQNMLNGNSALCSAECRTNLIPDSYKKR